MQLGKKISLKDWQWSKHKHSAFHCRILSIISHYSHQNLWNDIQKCSLNFHDIQQFPKIPENHKYLTAGQSNLNSC